MSVYVDSSVEVTNAFRRQFSRRVLALFIPAATIAVEMPPFSVLE
jgi:hypothetical protein